MARNTLPAFTSLVTLTVAGVSLLVGTIVLPGSDLSAVSPPQAKDAYSLEDLQGHRVDWREQRRLYSRAMETCRDRRHDGQAVDCTIININDPLTFQPFLTKSVPSVVLASDVSHAAAPELTVDMLSERDRSNLRRYHRGGSCPATLKNYLPGFYELCERVVEETQLPLGRGRMDSAAKKRVQSGKVPPPLTADDLVKAHKRPVPTVRVGVMRHTESRSSSSSVSVQ